MHGVIDRAHAQSDCPRKMSQKAVIRARIRAVLPK